MKKIKLTKEENIILSRLLLNRMLNETSEDLGYFLSKKSKSDKIFKLWLKLNPK